MSDPTPKFIHKGTYRHSKTGNLYEVVGVALQTESLEQLVIYRQLYENPDKTHQYELFARPYEMFTETVEIRGSKMPRFEYIGD